MTEKSGSVGVDQESSSARTEANAVTGGIACGRDGCVRLSPEEVAAIVESAERQKAERIARYPDEKTAIHALFDGWVRLKELGWREAIYAPIGQPLEVIEVGSTG